MIKDGRWQIECHEYISKKHRFGETMSERVTMRRLLHFYARFCESSQFDLNLNGLLPKSIEDLFDITGLYCAFGSPPAYWSDERKREIRMTYNVEREALRVQLREAIRAAIQRK